jgi:hypothetical protein
MNKNINQCLCCSSRRHFLRSFLPGVIAFTVLQSAQSAKAEVHQTKALVLSCIDFRFLTAEQSFLSNKKLSKSQFDTETFVLAKLKSSSSN